MTPQIKKLKLLKSLLEGDTSVLVDPIVDLETKVEEMAQIDWTGAPGKDAYTPVKGVDYFDGKDGESIKGDKGADGVSPDPKEVAKLVLSKIPKPKDGKDGESPDPAKIVQEVIKQIPEDKPEEIRDKLSSLEGEERLDIQFIKGLPDFSPDGLLKQLIKIPIDKRKQFVPFPSKIKDNNKMLAEGLWMHGGGSSILLQTNGVDNPDQNTLNLIAGTNITLAPDGSGGVTIDASGGGGETLAQTLAIGNVTGGNDIVLSTGDIIVGQTSAQMSAAGLNNYYFAGPSYIFQQFFDPGSGLTDFLLQGNGTQLYSDTGISIQTATGLYNFFNGNSNDGIFDFTNLTTDRTYTWPDQSGTVALVSDIPAAFITAVGDTNTIDLTVTGTTLTADLRYVDSASINFSDSGAGFTGVVIPAGADTYIQFNDGGVLGADADFTWNKTTNALSITGTITASGEIRTNTSFAMEETGAGTDIIRFQAPASIAASYTLTFPVDDGAPGEVLSTDGSGGLSWVTNGGTNYWQRTGTVLSPATSGDTVQIGSGTSDTDLAYGFTGDTNTGWWRENADTLTTVAGGTPFDTIRFAAGAGTYNINPDAADIDFFIEGQTDNGLFRTDADIDAIYMGLGEGLAPTSNTKVEIFVGDLYPNYLPFKVNHQPTDDTSSLISSTANLFFDYKQTTGSKTLSNNRLQQTAHYESDGGTLTLNHAMQAMQFNLDQTSGTLTFTDLKFEDFQRNINGGGSQAQWYTYHSGIHYNRYNGVAAIAFGVGAGVPDLWQIAFGANQATINAQYTIEGTGTWTAYTVSSAMKIVGAGWLHSVPVVDTSTKATTGLTGGYIQWHIYDAVTMVAPISLATGLAVPPTNQKATMDAALAVAYTFPGVGIVAYTDTDYNSIDWAVRGYM